MNFNRKWGIDSTFATWEYHFEIFIYLFYIIQFPGFVTISTIASDEVSGFATYICTPDVQCTSTEAATYFDVSGASVNFVTVPIDAKDAGILKVLVRGDGRYSGNNKFVLAASKYIRPQNWSDFYYFYLLLVECINNFYDSFGTHSSIIAM